MANKIVTASGKGGVGKSTTAAALGMILSEKGLNTLLVDCDAGLGSMDVLLGKAEETAFNWLDVYNKSCPFDGAAIKINDRLSLLSAPEKKPENADENCLKDIISEIEDKFDYIIFDAPAGIGAGLKRAAIAAEKAVIIATADEVSVRGAEKTDEILRNAGINETRLLINRYSVKDAKKGKLLGIDEVIDKTYVRLLGVIPEDKEISSFSVTRRVSKNSKSLSAFRRVAERIQGKNTKLTLSLIK
ncbi:MAG: AAA family ATPase [Oscillospiraceae bacterium]|nr:AAA family ATPase [Oscillospiraceae bacterium]